MKFLNKKDYIIGMLVIIIVILIFGFTNELRMADDKHTEVVELLEHKADVLSDIEILEQGAKRNNMLANENLAAIEVAKMDIKEMKTLHKYNIASRDCFVSQMERKANGLEFQLDYCENKDNLDQFIKKD